MIVKFVTISSKLEKSAINNECLNPDQTKSQFEAVIVTWRHTSGLFMANKFTFCWLLEMENLSVI